jgi:hypothetical protein
MNAWKHQNELVLTIGARISFPTNDGRESFQTKGLKNPVASRANVLLGAGFGCVGLTGVLAAGPIPIRRPPEEAC